MEADTAKRAIKKARDKRCYSYRPKKPKADGPMITQQELHDLFIHDDEAGVLRWRHDTKRHKAGEIAGRRTPGVYGILRINNRAYVLHRLIWLYVHGRWPEWPNMVIDHINHDRQDNRLCNLREIPYEDNHHNLPPRKAGHPNGHVGVFWSKRQGKWGARIAARRKMIHLGTFETKEEAIAARKAGELKHHPSKPVKEGA